MKFQDSLVLGVDNAGHKAADKLLGAVKSHLIEKFPSSDNWDVFVKAYANVNGLAKALVNNERIGSVEAFRLFVTEFTSRLAYCDFVDVGYGIERADNKVKGIVIPQESLFKANLTSFEL
jgi:hypothetical protein